MLEDPWSNSPSLSLQPRHSAPICSTVVHFPSRYFPGRWATMGLASVTLRRDAVQQLQQLSCRRTVSSQSRVNDSTPLPLHHPLKQQSSLCPVNQAHNQSVNCNWVVACRHDSLYSLQSTKERPCLSPPALTSPPAHNASNLSAQPRARHTQRPDAARRRRRRRRSSVCEVFEFPA
ncbi:hypothetical protein EJ06DRAFT_48536 [Trichodelitschia bisporula]|uniref:Uncharacterized protein n=1 Tax=Trichodelitschia bisporula TaxID=703511 RepID=A0A6G1HU40_9PEZI|nr:hypothetical protein EJ06DRAFT_48536 [Trichodelitschia bisporula]